MQTESEYKTLFEELKEKISLLLRDIKLGLKPYVEEVHPWEIYYTFPGGVEVRIMEAEGSWRPYFMMKSKRPTKIRQFTRPVICECIVDNFQVETLEEVDRCITYIKNELEQESAAYFSHGKQTEQEL